MAGRSTPGPRSWSSRSRSPGFRRPRSSSGTSPSGASAAARFASPALLALACAALLACSESISLGDLPTAPIAYIRQGASEGILSLEKFREAARLENPDDARSTKPRLVTTLSLLAPETGEHRPVPDAGLGAVPCDWSADGTRLLVGRVDARSSGLELYTWNLATGAWTRVQRGPVGSGAGIADGPIRLAWHGPIREGRAFSGGIFIESAATARELLPGSKGGVTPDLSPDGRTVVYSRVSEGSNLGATIFLHTTGESEPRALTRGASPRFSRDGKWIAFTRQSRGSSDVWLMRADGSAKRQVTATSFDEEFPAISPDGRYVVYASARGDESESLLYLSRVADGAEREIVHSGLNTRPVW